MTPKGLMRTLSESDPNAQTDFHFLRVEQESTRAEKRANIAVMTNGCRVLVTQVHTRGKARAEGRDTELNINTERKESWRTGGNEKGGVINEEKSGGKRGGG